LRVALNTAAEVSLPQVGMHSVSGYYNGGAPRLQEGEISKSSTTDLTVH